MSDLETLWRDYQFGQISADHTDKQVFCEVVGKRIAELEAENKALAYQLKCALSDVRVLRVQHNESEKLFMEQAAEIERLREDAIRYRYLRVYVSPAYLVSQGFDDFGYIPPAEGIAERIDKMVDALSSKEGE